jgi:hypothetical protein
MSDILRRLILVSFVCIFLVPTYVRAVGVVCVSGGPDLQIAINNNAN